MGLSAEAGTGAMVVEDSLHSGIARLSRDGGGVAVPLAPLDGLALGAPSLIKIDVEGHEADVLEGAAKTLAETRPFVVFESWREWHDPRTTLAPFEILTVAGYRFFHPVWVEERDGEAVAGADPARFTAPSFGLVEFAADQRFLLADQINVLAVPGDRLVDLEAAFA